MNLPKVGRNDPCPCGSGKKYKNCHYGKEVPKTYTADGKRKFKAKVISATDKSTDVFQKAPPIPTIADIEKDSSFKFKLSDRDYRIKKESESIAPSSFSPSEATQPIPEAKPFEPLQIPEGEFEATQKDYQIKKEEQE